MSPTLDLGSLKRSPLVNRVRNVYRNNTNDSALETLRMESVNISHVRDLSVGLESSSSDSSEDSFQRINFSHNKRFHERVLRRNRSRSNESLKLERNNTFSEIQKRLNVRHHSLVSSADGFETPYDSDYKTPNKSSDEFSPLTFLLNYRSCSNHTEDYRDVKSLSSFRSLMSDDANFQKTSKAAPVKSEPSETPSPKHSSTHKKPGFGSKDTLGSDELGFQSIKSDASISKTTYKTTHSCDDNTKLRNVDGPEGLSYSFDKSFYVFRIVFEPKLSTVKDTSLIPSRVMINKTPFVIGSDSSCDLLLSDKKFKFISPRHCKISFQSYSSNHTAHSSIDEHYADVEMDTPSNKDLTSPINGLTLKITNKVDFSDHNGTVSPPNSYNTSHLNSYEPSPKVNSSSPSSLGEPNGTAEATSNQNETNTTDKEDIVSYKVKISKASPNGIIYVNNVLLRGTLYLENGDLVSLGSKNNNLTFRVLFQSKKECQLLKYQLSRPASVRFDTKSDKFISINNSTVDTDTEVYVGENKHSDDQRIVLFDNVNVTGVKIFVFQVFNYRFDPNLNDEEDEDEFSQNMAASEDQQVFSCKELDSQNEDKMFGQSKEHLDAYNESKDKLDAQYTPLNKLFNEYLSQQSKDPNRISYLLYNEDYYKLRSPMRNYNILKPRERNNKKERRIKNLDSIKADALIEVYSPSDRMSASVSNYNMTQDSNCSMVQLDSQASVTESQLNADDSQFNVVASQSELLDSQFSGSASENSASSHSAEYKHKVKFLKSINPNSFPIAIDTNNTTTSGSTTPRHVNVHYKLIGTVDACNNMNISELLPSIDELVRNEIDENLINFQVVLRKFNTPVQREMLEKSWVFQLEILDIDIPKIKRAIFRNEQFKNGREELERVIKENKCRVMYIKTD